MSEPSGLLRELRHRKVFRTAALYIIAAWVILQVADLAFPGLRIPQDAIRYVWIGAFLGFPLAILFGWMYQITPDGIVRSAPLGAGETTDLSLKGTDYVLLTALVIVAGAITVGLLGEIREAEMGDEVVQRAREVHPNSIAVLPLNNLTGDPEQEYFVAGIHEALIAGLSRISALTVISRTSADVYRNVVKPLPDIGRELSVANLIEGSVFRSGDEVRITVQLIDADTDENLWAENYKRNVRDIFSLQGEVARTIAEEIQVTLTEEEESRLRVAHAVDPEIYQAYLRGMFHLKKYTPEGIAKGLDYLHDALATDPRNAGAYAGLALGYNTIGHGTGGDAFPKAMAAARRALEIDEYSGEAWAALSEAQLYYDWDWKGSEESANRALQLNPNLDHVRAHFSYLLALLGRWDEAFAEVEAARQLSPLDPTWSAFAAWLYALVNRHDEASAAINDSLELQPGNPFGLYILGHVLATQGRLDEAIEAHEKIARDDPISNWALGPTYAMAGRYDEARQIAAAMSNNPGPRDRLHLAFTYAGLGEAEEALRWLESCYETRVDWLPWIVIDNSYGGVLDSMRDDSRFKALIAKFDIPAVATTEKK